MKKKNIFLLILLGLITLGFNTKVLADDGIIGFLECKYKFDDSSVINQDYVDDNGVVSFYYSELSTSVDTLKRNVYVKHNVGAIYKAVNTFTNKAKDFSPTYFTESLKNADETFRNFVDRDGTCPKYLMLKSSGKNNYIPYFDNNIERCGADLSGCPVIGNNVSGGEKYIVYRDEKDWNYNFSGKGACDGASLRIYVDGNKLKGDISYPTISSFYEKSGGDALKGIDIYIGYDNGGFHSLDFIYNLFKNNKIPNGFIRGDKKAKINFYESVVHSATCPFDQVFVTPKYNCTTYTEFKSEINQIEDSYRIMAGEYKDFIDNKLCGDNNDCDYSKYTKEQAKDLLLKIKKQNESGDYLADLYGKISDYYTQKQNDVCSEFKAKIQQDLENIQNLKKTSVGDKEDPESGTSKLAAVAQALEDRATALEDEELQNLADEVIKGNEEVAQRIQNYYRVLEQKFFADVSLSFQTGCGIITPKLKDWLIRGLDIMKIVALILTLILGMVDFFKGVASGNADTMKKVWTSFSRRLIVVVILFLLPIIFEFIFGMINIDGVISSDPLCGIK